MRRYAYDAERAVHPKQNEQRANLEQRGGKVPFLSSS